MEIIFQSPWTFLGTLVMLWVILEPIYRCWRLWVVHQTIRASIKQGGGVDNVIDRLNRTHGN